MFFINQSNKNLSIIIIDENNKAVKSGGEHQLINKIKQLVVIGQSTMHDNFLTTYTDQNSLTFIGAKIAEFEEKTPVDLYGLANNAGFIFHDHATEQIFVSQSFYQLTNYCLGLGFSIFGILAKSAISHGVVQKHIINNDFNSHQIRGDELNYDALLGFDLHWNSNENQMSFEMIIKNEDFKVDNSNPLYTKLTGTAINIGHFTKTVLGDLEEGDRIPDLFPELELNDCIVFTELENDNALSVLVPNIMSYYQYNSLINEMRMIDRKKLSYSGSSKLGYGIQADIHLLEEFESLPHYQAKITRLIITPNDIITRTFLES